MVQEPPPPIEAAPATARAWRVLPAPELLSGWLAAAWAPLRPPEQPAAPLACHRDAHVRAGFCA